MNTVKTIAIVLITAGVLGLAYGGFTYTRGTQETQMGPFSMTFKDRRTVAVPIWLGVGAVIIGAGLLLVPPRKS
jgi:multidrug transporter EmrE-like cation transporter